MEIISGGLCEIHSKPFKFEVIYIYIHLLAGFYQVCPESSLQEFLEELDALCAPEVERVNPETDDENTKPRASVADHNRSVSSSVLKASFSENSDTDGTETASQLQNGSVEEDRLNPLPEGSEASCPKPDEKQPVEHTESCSHRGNGA